MSRDQNVETIQAWLIDLSPSVLPPAEALLANLDSVESARYERLKPEPAKRRFVAAHAAMRAILARQLNSSPDRIKFETDALGKPRLSNVPIEFNLSHSADWAAIAIAQAGPIGIDMELVREIPNLLRMIDFICSPRERTAFTGIDNPAERLRHFLDIWTRKEAILKAWGYGLRLDPRTIEIAAAGDGKNGRPRLETMSLAVGPQLIASLASPPMSTPSGVVHFDWHKEAF